MTSRRILLTAAILLSCAALLRAEDKAKPIVEGSVRHELLCADSGLNRVVRFSADGQVKWEYPAYVYDVWQLPGGNLLFTDRDGVKEVTPNKKIVFQYKTRSEVYACQRLSDGNTMVAECSAGRIIEVDPSGKVVKQFPVENRGHMTMRMARKLPNGNYLVGHSAARRVREYSPEGKVVREIPTPGTTFAAVRLPDGNTLISCETAVIEVDPAGKTVWQVKASEIPEMGPKWLAGVQRLPNGNTLLCNWLGHGQEGKGVPMFEITRDKKIVWQFNDTKLTRNVTNVFLLDVPGDPIKGEVLR